LKAIHKQNKPLFHHSPSAAAEREEPDYIYTWPLSFFLSLRPHASAKKRSQDISALNISLQAFERRRSFS